MRISTVFITALAVLSCFVQFASAAKAKKPATKPSPFSASFFDLSKSKFIVKGRDAKLQGRAIAVSEMVKGSAAYRTNKLCRPDSKLCPVLGFNQVFKVNSTRKVPMQYAVYIQGVNAKPVGSVNAFGKRSSLLIGKSKLAFIRTMLTFGQDSYVLTSGSVISMATSVFSGVRLGLVGFYKTQILFRYCDIKLTDSLIYVDKLSSFGAYRSGISISGASKPFMVEGKFVLEEGTLSLNGVREVIFSNSRSSFKNCALVLTNTNLYFLNAEVNFKGVTMTVKNSVFLLSNFRTKGPDYFFMNNPKGKFQGIPKQIPYPFVSIATFNKMSISGTGRLALSSKST